MGPVHAVLANSDLLTMVFPAKADSDYECKELFRLALVCRKFCAVALDILWKTVHHIDQIYCLFPRHIISTSPVKKSFSTTPTTHDQWARFETYAWRIRKLYVTHPRDHDLYTVLGCHPSRCHPFAHLTCLRWVSDISLVSHATLMMSATLADISFDLDGYGPDDVMADVMQTAKETCTHLRGFKYSHTGAFIPTSTAFETSLVSLIRSSVYLRKISVPTNYRVWDALALLPSLTQVYCSPPAEISENGWNVTHPAGLQSPDQETFVALELLNIWSTFTSIGSLRLFLEPFGKIASKPRVHLSIKISPQDPRSFAEIPQHLYDALPPNLRIGLEVFCINQNWGPDVFAPVYSWRSFSWLLTCPHLRSLGLYTHSLANDDIAFAEMAQKWPELRTLFLSTTDSSVDPLATFRGLVHLSLLPKLRDLCITIGPNCAIARPLLYGEQISTSPLRRLELRGDFPNADTHQVALFLTKHFPNLKKLQTQPESQWKEVKSRMRFLRKVLPEIPDGRVRLTSGR